MCSCLPCGLREQVPYEEDPQNLHFVAINFSFFINRTKYSLPTSIMIYWYYPVFIKPRIIIQVNNYISDIGLHITYLIHYRTFNTRLPILWHHIIPHRCSRSPCIDMGIQGFIPFPDFHPLSFDLWTFCPLAWSFGELRYRVAWSTHHHDPEESGTIQTQIPVSVITRIWIILLNSCR